MISPIIFWAIAISELIVIWVLITKYVPEYRQGLHAVRRRRNTTLRRLRVRTFERIKMHWMAEGKDADYIASFSSRKFKLFSEI